MGLTHSKLKNLEKRILKQKKPEEDTNIVIPKDWVSFARMSKVRSAGKIVNFEPYGYQRKLVEVMLERSVILIKARQMGCSELVINFMLWRAALSPGYMGCVFSRTQVDASLLARRLRRAITGLGLRTTTENLGDVELESGGRILFRSSKADSARGIESVVDVFLDEYGFQPEGKQLFDAIQPAQQMVGADARVFVVSTPNGRSGHYWDLVASGNEQINVEQLCSEVSAGRSEPFQYWVDSGGWGKAIVHWKAHPIYGSNLNFLQEIHKKKKLSWEIIRQEYDLSFQESDSNYFDFQTINKCLDGEKESPKERAIYFIGVDPNFEGDNYCVASVLKYSEEKGFSLVDWYRKRKTSSEYNLFYISELIKKFCNPIVTIETNSGGRIYFEQLSKSHIGNAYIIGATTSEDSKQLFLERFKLVMERGLFHAPKDSPLTEELLTFRRKGKKLGAAEGSYDDFVMSVSLALIGAVEKGFL